METKIVRLSSGEEIICWMPYADYKELEIDNKFIMFIIKPQVELMNQYNENLGNGLVVPDKKVAAPSLTLST